MKRKQTTPKLSKLGYPEWVTVLEAGDFCRGNYTKGDKHCITGWINEIFPSPDLHDNHFNITSYKRTPANNRARAVLLKLITEKIKKHTLGDYCGSIEGFSDWTSLKLNLNFDVFAKLFNKMLARIGYVVNNPEA